MRNNSFIEYLIQELTVIFNMKNTSIIVGILYFVISLILMGCAQNTHESGESKAFIVDYHTKNTELFEAFFDINKMSIIRFEDDNPLLLSENIQLVFTEDYIFLLDKGAEQLFRFDHSGRLVNKIGRSGRGPAEYSNVTFFVTETKTQTVDILSNNGSAIMTFDFDGNFVKKFSTPFIVTSFDRLNSNLYYYYTGYSNSPNFHRLHMADTTSILESYLPLQTQAIDMIEMNFTPMDDYGYFREIFFPTVYKYNAAGIEEIFAMNFGGCAITQQMLEEVEDPFVFFENIGKDGFCSTSFLVANNNTFYVVAFHHDLRANQVSHFYVDLADSVYTRVVTSSNQKIANDFFSQLKPVYLDSEGHLFFVTSAMDLKAFIQSRSGLLQTDPLHEEYFNPLIIRVPKKK